MPASHGKHDSGSWIATIAFIAKDRAGADVRDHPMVAEAIARRDGGVRRNRSSGRRWRGARGPTVVPTLPGDVCANGAE
jgi:hypothetical protein